MSLYDEHANDGRATFEREKVCSLDEALVWFLEHSMGHIICVKKNTSEIVASVEKECSCFIEAEKFYKSN